MGNRMIPFGYCVEKGMTIVKESEARTVGKIFADYLAGASLKKIADDLSACGIEYDAGKNLWDKRLVARILENESYTGKGIYSPIITADIYKKANEIKAGRQIEHAEHSAAVGELRAKVYCADCGKKYHRIAVWKTREKWICGNGCKNGFYLSDYVLSTAIRNAAAKRKELETPISTYAPNADIIRYGNEITRMMNTAEPSYNACKQLILAFTAAKFLACKNPQTSNRLSAMLGYISCVDDITPMFVKQAIKKIEISNKEITVVWTDDTRTAVTPVKEVKGGSGKKNSN